MKNYVLPEKPSKSPEIILTHTGEIMIRGNSKPENPHTFYKDLFEWIEAFIATSPSRINITFELDYINSSSEKVFLLMLKKIRTGIKDGCDFNVNWIYEKNDTDSIEQGKLFEENIKAKFNFIEKP